jgi:signal transduction histidine kinase
MSGSDLKPMAELAGIIAHDINNLLSAIRGYAELARAGMPEGDQAWDDIEQLLRTADRAEELTGQLHAFSRKVLETGATGRPEASGLAPMLQRLLAEAGLQDA